MYRRPNLAFTIGWRALVGEIGLANPHGTCHNATGSKLVSHGIILWSLYTLAGEPKWNMTYKAPSKKMVVRPILFFKPICKLLTIFTGRMMMIISKTTSTTPVANQNMLKLKQYSAGVRLVTQLHFTGQQLKILANEQVIQNRTTRAPIA